MELAWLFIATFFLAGLVLLFGYLWYSKLFVGVMKKEHNSQKEKVHHNSKKLLAAEFGTNVLHALCIVFIFSPYSPLYGLVNGLIVVLGIILPFSISSSIWEGRTLKVFFVKFGHRAISLLIYFIGIGKINSILFPLPSVGLY